MSLIKSYVMIWTTSSMCFPCRWFTQTLGILIMLIGTESLWQQSQLLQRERKGEINKTPKKKRIIFRLSFSNICIFSPSYWRFFNSTGSQTAFLQWQLTWRNPLSSESYVMIQTIRFFFPCQCFTQTFGILTIFIGAESPYQPSRILHTEQKGKINKIQLRFFLNWLSKFIYL